MSAALAAVREPIIVILFLIAFFTAISGKPLDGLLLFIVAAGLAWDAAVRYRGRVPAPACAVPGAEPGAAAGAAAGAEAGAGTGAAACATAAASAPRAAATLPQQRPGMAPARRGRLLVLAGLAAAAAYAAAVGSFSRYSWSATVGVIAVGAAVVALGWRGPLRRRPDPGPLPMPGAMLWAAVLVAGGLWELVSLLQQPNLATGSYAHPTISTLTDPLLASHPGRSVALAAWLALGWFLAGR
jgi:hypothetical protein